ncbi:MAG: hypothetical protein QXR92_04415 [Fervidicoccaceae archaeon]|uniref:hypothetical protein n=1 Tax=Metallosphaera sp. TaxID=2020860 RepID=UPI00315EA8EE
MIDNYNFSVEFKAGDVINLVNEIGKQWKISVNQMKVVIDGIPMAGKSQISKIVSDALNMRLVRYSPKNEIDREFHDFLKEIPGGTIVDGSPISLLCSLPNWKRYIARYVKVLDSVINDNYPTFMILVEPLNDEDLVKLSSIYEYDMERANWVAECVSTFQIMSKTYEIFRHVSLPKRLLTSDN